VAKLARAVFTRDEHGTHCGGVPVPLYNKQKTQFVRGELATILLRPLKAEEATAVGGRSCFLPLAPYPFAAAPRE